MKAQELATQLDISSSSINAIIRKLGGWSRTQELAPDIVNNGMQGGFSGFHTCYETTMFFKHYKKDILCLLQKRATEFGMSKYQFISQHPILKDGDQNSILRVLTARPNYEKDRSAINALVWDFVEEFARFITSK